MTASAAPTKGEPLSHARRFRLRFLTAVFVLLFLIGHVVAYATTISICHCQAFAFDHLAVDTIRAILFIALTVLYVAGWAETIRMLYVRWWPHWGTRSPAADPDEAVRPMPRYIGVCALLAILTLLVIIGCDVFEPGRQPRGEWRVGAAVGVFGSLVGLYGAWFIRVAEPSLPIRPTEGP